MNKLIPYKEGIISRICNWIKSRFLIRKDEKEKKENNNLVANNTNIMDRFVIPEDREKTRLLKLRWQWENNEIDAEDLSDEDVNKIVELYNKETERINRETSVIKENISKMLKELKNEG